MTSSSTYIGVTVGPINKTLLNAKKTRELWAGSYIFSYIMRELITHFHEKGRLFVIPFVNDCVLSERNGIGMFHDRCIFKSDSGDLADLRAKADEILGDIGDKWGNREYAKKYFQLSWCELEESGNYKNAVERMNKALDVIELQQRFIPEEELNFISDALKSKSYKFYKEAGRTLERFPSIPEIATRDLDLPERFFDENDKEDEPLYELIKTEIQTKQEEDKRKNIKPYSLKKYFKYIAIVKADGDNLSKAIASLSDDGAFSEFSKKLFDFSIESHKIIEAYGGTTVFVGGDDLLFFAPLKNKNKNIFGLIEELSELYQQIVSGDATLSFGVSLSYYKYPLYEALQAANDLLSEAKKGDKNAVAVRLLKHSGKEADVVLSKQSPYDIFRALTQKSLSDARLFTSLIATLTQQSCILDQVGADAKRVENFLANSFNEEIHKKNADFMKTLGEIICRIYTDAKLGDEDSKRNTLFAMLKTAIFLQED